MRKIDAHASLQFNDINGRISERRDDVGGETYTGGRYDSFGIRLRVND